MSVGAAVIGHRSCGPGEEGEGPPAAAGPEEPAGADDDVGSDEADTSCLLRSETQKQLEEACTTASDFAVGEPGRSQGKMIVLLLLFCSILIGLCFLIASVFISHETSGGNMSTQKEDTLSPSTSLIQNASNLFVALGRAESKSTRSKVETGSMSILTKTSSSLPKSESKSNVKTQVASRTVVTKGSSSSHSHIAGAVHPIIETASHKPGVDVCDEVPWDGWTAQFGGPKFAICLGDLNRGRFGNQLFRLAKSIAVAYQLKMPILVTKQRVWQRIPFRCLRTSRLIQPRASDMRCSNKAPFGGGAFFQTLLDWGSRSLTPVLLPIFRKAFHLELPSNDPAVGMPPPGPQDLVIYFRTFIDGWHAGKEEEPFERKALNHYGPAYQIMSPPFAFFNHVVQTHWKSFGKESSKIWVLAQPRQRRHPTVRRIVRELQATIYTRGDRSKHGWLADWLWLKSAKHVAISASTYGWWAAFLSESSKIYLPIYPGRTGFGTPWCKLFPNRDPRYVFYDWWKDHSYSSSEDGVADEAYKVCMRYALNCNPKLMVNWVNKVLPACSLMMNVSDLKPFYPELN